MTPLKTEGLFIRDYVVVRRLIPSGGEKTWADFHLRPAPTERAVLERQREGGER